MQTTVTCETGVNTCVTMTTTDIKHISEIHQEKVTEYQKFCGERHTRCETYCTKYAINIGIPECKVCNVRF